MIRVTARQAMRRAGLHWPSGPTLLAIGSLAAEALALLAADPNFVVELPEPADTRDDPVLTTATGGEAAASPPPKARRGKE